MSPISFCKKNYWSSFFSLKTWTPPLTVQTHHGPLEGCQPSPTHIRSAPMGVWAALTFTLLKPGRVGVRQWKFKKKNKVTKKSRCVYITRKHICFLWSLYLPLSLSQIHTQVSERIQSRALQLKRGGWWCGGCEGCKGCNFCFICPPTPTPDLTILEKQ